MSGNQAVGYAAAELREAVKGGIDPEDFNALTLAGLVPETVARRLMSERHAYNNAPLERRNDGYYYCETARYQRKATQYIHLGIRKALDQGNLALINYALGILADEGASRDFVEMKRLERYLAKEGRLLVWGGQMGNGKTNGALRVCEFYREIYPNVIFASNIPSWLEAETVTTPEELEDWMDEHPDEKKAVVLDEMSSSTAHATNGKQVLEQLSGLIRTMRHKHVDLMQIIGHRVQADIHPSIHKLADICLKKELETLSVYEQMAGDVPDGKKFEWDIAETTMTYDTHEDETPWEWLDEDDEDAEDWASVAQNIAVDLLTNTDLNGTEVAAYFEGVPGCSQSNLSRLAGGAA